MNTNKRVRKKNKKKFIAHFSILLVFTTSAYLCGAFLLQIHITSGARKIIQFEEKGHLSRTYGYVWHEINANRAMNQNADYFTESKTLDTVESHSQKRPIIDFPSLEAVSRLNSIKRLAKAIRINDRHGIPLVQLESIHTSTSLSQLNKVLIKSLLATEDKHFYSRKYAYDYNALLRASFRALVQSIRSMRFQYPKGSSTIHMQVARFLLLKYDTKGFAYSEKTISRKIKELKLAQALMLRYSNDEILTLYINHCVTAGRGMRGYHDISRGLFGVYPDSLTIPQSLYLARLVKWNKQVPKKIIHQIKLSSQALSETFHWTPVQLKSIMQSLDTLTFRKKAPVIPQHSHLIDLANEYWRKVCQLNGMDGTALNEMDIADPQSRMRRYGNLTINLTIDYRLQKLLEKIVAERGFGRDTTIRSDVRIGAFGINFCGTAVPKDTLRKIWIVAKDTLFSPSKKVSVSLHMGDTIVTNIRYNKITSDTIRRSCYYYKRGAIRVPGQYYAYAIMDSRTYQLLAYCSKDRLGSRLRSLLVNKTPNGSSVAKPLIFALAYDLGIYQPADMASDDQEVPDTCDWARSYEYEGKIPVGMKYTATTARDGYPVHNFGRSFEGHDFLFNHLARSNNIIAVETLYRLNTDLNSNRDQVRRVKHILNNLNRRHHNASSLLTGPQLYSVIVSTMRNKKSKNKSIARNYSIALGTLELSLYEQLHLFNTLYGNRIVVSPSKYPSLFIKQIEVSGNKVLLDDKITTRKLFNKLENVNPVHLALHKRMTSDPADRLGSFDVCGTHMATISNFAKSGTTDDIIRPFNADVTDSARTCYGLWNAVHKLRLTRNDMKNAVALDASFKNHKFINITYDSVPSVEILDITLSSIGECNKQYTGARDGKSLHGYVSRSLLHSFGVSCRSGFYESYEKKLLKTAPNAVKYISNEKTDLNFFSRAFIKLKTGIRSRLEADQIIFDSKLRLKGKSYRKMMRFSVYMGKNSKKYLRLLGKLKNPGSKDEAKSIISKIREIPLNNQVLKRDIEIACESLMKSLGRQKY